MVAMRFSPHRYLVLRPRSTGMTLLEMMLALMLGLLMLTIAIPSVNGLVEQRESERELRALSRELAEISRRCREESREAHLEIRKEGLFVVHGAEEEQLLLELDRNRGAAFLVANGNQMTAMREPLRIGRKGQNFPVTLEITGRRPLRATLGPLNGALVPVGGES